VKRTANEIAQTIDHTLLRPEATTAEIERLCWEAVENGFAGVCVNPCHISCVAKTLDSACGRDRRRPRTVTPIGFPLGATHSETKADEARRSLNDGADEADMVVALGFLIAGDPTHVSREIAAVASVVHGSGPGKLLKVILETAALTRDQIILGCRCATEGEADFVKTSTGLHPAGGATAEHVRLLHRYASPLRVKASGGIRSLASANEMLDAGAVRIGTSSAMAILDEIRRFAP